VISLAACLSIRAEEVTGWEAFEQHHRLFWRKLLAFPVLTLALLTVGWAPDPLQKTAAMFLETAWIVFMLYFIAVNGKSQWRLACPGCGEKFCGAFRMRWDKCRNCGMQVWTRPIREDRNLPSGSGAYGNH
jgi:hypothetical protein